MFNLTLPSQPTPGQPSIEEAKGEVDDDPTDVEKLELLLGKAARGSARKRTPTLLQILTPGSTTK